MSVSGFYTDMIEECDFMLLLILFCRSVIQPYCIYNYTAILHKNIFNIGHSLIQVNIAFPK